MSLLLSRFRRRMYIHLTDRRAIGSAWKIRSHVWVVSFFCIMLLETVPALPAQAGLASLKPVLFNYHSKLTMQTVYSANNKTTSEGLDDTANRLGFRESLSLRTSGYVYHPNLMVFDLEGTYGEDQSRLTANDDKTAAQQGSYDAYDFRALLLRTKPYTLEVFANKAKTFATSEKASVQDDKIKQESGAEFNYKKREYKTKLEYKNITRLKDGTSSSTGNYDFDGSFNKPKFGSLDDFAALASLRYQDNTNTISGIVRQGETSKQSQLFNSFGYKIFDFSTGISALSTELGSGQESQLAYVHDFLSFNENISINLPWDFTSSVLVMANRGNNDSNFVTSASESSNNNDRVSFNLTQKLYDSLVTRFIANMDSSQTQRTDLDNSIDMEPISGESDRRDYRLESRYRKLLPYNSVGTGFVKSTDNRTNRLGSNVEYLRPVASEEEVGEIQFELKDIDTEGMTVEVLKENPNIEENPNTQCESAFKNPRASFPNCWIPLSVGDYTLTKSIDTDKAVVSTFKVDTISLTERRDFDYASFDKKNGLLINVPFRVVSVLRPVNAMAQTNSFGAGATLFNFFSSNYSHSVTTQEGNYSGIDLEQGVIVDRIDLSFFREDFSTGVSRQWLRATGDETITEAKTSYGKKMKFFERITVAFAANAHTGREEVADTQGNSLPSSEHGYDYSLDAGMPLPYIGATLKAKNSYSYTKGSLVRLAFNRDGVIIPTQDLGIDEKTRIRNSVALSKSFDIPWIKLFADSYVRYQWETTSGKDNTDHTGVQYGISARRTWRLGATTISLNGKYASDELIFDDGISYRSTSKGTVREAHNENISVMLSVARQLF